MDQNKIDPQHSAIRAILRTIGPIVLIMGILFTIVGVASSFLSFGSGIPRLFWCAFVGLPLIGIGSMMIKLGYMGRISRYMADEMAPVAKDTINYMAEGTRQGVKTTARAFAEGLAEGGVPLTKAEGMETKVRCHKCNSVADEHARFCDQCGAPVVKTKLCPECNELNDPDAKFCDNCGHKYK
ncbi:MAG: zinc ribbon domain-containing protein [Sedimentisphaerales bacterium]|nr:zinc ribbon domain-containing protein [Sedimentisphaerales bacterium]